MNASWRLITGFLFSPDNDENIVLSLLTLVASIIPHRLGHIYFHVTPGSRELDGRGGVRRVITFCVLVPGRSPSTVPFYQKMLGFRMLGSYGPDVCPLNI